jgi:exopolysaccharide biosynthesis polyprenyl glycosylphosphotransferase
MATSGLEQSVSASVSAIPEWTARRSESSAGRPIGAETLWMIADAITVFSVVTLTILYELYIVLSTTNRRLLLDNHFHGTLVAFVPFVFCVFTAILIVVSKRLQLYSPRRIASSIQEQRLSLQACMTAGLLLAGTFYLTGEQEIPRGTSLAVFGLVTIALALRRLAYRTQIDSESEKGKNNRNVLIVGSGPVAHSLRRRLESTRYPGYTCKGIINIPPAEPNAAVHSSAIVRMIETLFIQARESFVDEIFLACPCEPKMLHFLMEEARVYKLGLRMIPYTCHESMWDNPIEFIGSLPTFPLHVKYVSEGSLAAKRAFDIAFSGVFLLVLSPAMLAIALLVKLDSPGPVFYLSERVGKRGHMFRCIKFRTMVQDAEERRAHLLEQNERDEVLFKVSNDPRVTRLGRYLRKYSLDELPQFFNVLRSDMSVVGPRPPLVSEVLHYKPKHLRRLDVTPGVTGLWQVEARQDPSFDSYISLDLSYIDNWSFWLDVQIILRTFSVVFAGTGS